MLSNVEIVVESDASASTPSDQGFLRIQRLTLRTRYEDGTLSERYRYDVVERNALDAVLMVLHTRGDDGVVRVCVRSALRPPIALRATRTPKVPVPDARPYAMLWELPAGLIEANAVGEQAVWNTAARETAEETGYNVEASEFRALGAAVYLSPGLCAEKLHIVHARVDTTRRVDNASSGEVVEVPSKVEWWTIEHALEQASRGVLEDCKTELALWRLQSWLRANGGV